MKQTLIGNLDEEEKAVAAEQAQAGGDASAEILGPRAGFDLDRFVRIVREVDFVEDLKS